MDGDALPSGYVTFVFTDIEGSTRVLKRLGDHFVSLVERHEELLRDAFGAKGGHIVSTGGDSVFAAFADSTAAVEACCRAQELITAEPWPEDGNLKIRIGLHVGLAKPRHDDYLALAVNQAARVMAAGHGGQILLTDAVVERVDPAVRESVTPIGTYRLRDFDDPPLLHQTTAWSGPRDNPVRATPTKGHNLNPPVTSFVDRKDEAAELQALLQPGAVVSLTGPGGVGKSRLANDVGIELAGDWPDGVWAMELADVEDPSLIVDRLGDVLAVERDDTGQRLDDVLERLRSRHMVVIYDGVERHVHACSQLIATIHRECPNVAQLATGHEPLRIPGEARVRIEPLPTLPAANISVEDIGGADTTTLFVDRAQAARAEVELDDVTLLAIAEVCRRLDGLPLAIEIAAAHVDVMTVPEIVEGLDNRFSLLRSHDRSLPARQRTMRALLEWSTDLLEPDERTTLRRLAIFTSGFTLEAAASAVADADVATDDVPELLWSLADKSLVAVEPTAPPTTYRLRETVQLYARGLLRGAGEDLVVAERVARWFDDRIGPQRAVDHDWINAMHVGQSNLRAVLGLVVDEDPELAQRLGCALGRYHDAIQTLRPGIEEVGRYVAQLTEPTPTRVALITTLADLHLRTGAVEPARELANEAAALEETVGSPAWGAAALDRTRGEIALRSGEPAEAAAIAEAALACELAPRAAARMWNLLGIARVSLGDTTGAFAAFEHELAIYLDLGAEGVVASAHGNLAEVALRNDDLALAAEHQSKCLDLALALGQPVMLAYSNVVAAQLAARNSDWRTAVALQSNSDAALAEIGHTLYEPDVETSTALLTEARSHLPAAAFDDARAFGLGLDAVGAAELADGVFAAGSKDRTTTQRN